MNLALTRVNGGFKWAIQRLCFIEWASQVETITLRKRVPCDGSTDFLCDVQKRESLDNRAAPVSRLHLRSTLLALTMALMPLWSFAFLKKLYFIYGFCWFVSQMKNVKLN